jgi:PiT family inorganic phosphate transporter
VTLPALVRTSSYITDPAYFAYPLMAAGGLLFAHRVAETMSHRVTPMNPGQGFAANLITAALVLGASRFGLPVSTTHVSNGSLFGLGAVTRGARWRIIMQILLAWVVTLPFSALCAALLWRLVD